MRFIEVTDLAAYLHRELDSGDALANFACDVATDVVREYIDQNVEEGSTTVKLDGDGCSDALFLPQHPVTSITTVTIDKGLATEEVLATTDYELGDAGIIYRLLNGAPMVWPWGHRNITVKYKSGYEVLPFTVTGVATQVAARIYDAGMMSNESIGAWSGTYVEGGAGLTTYEKDVLSHHRLDT